MNWVGCWALFMKEVRRFYSVAVQTIFAPVVASLLYLLIFGQVIEARMDVYTGLSYSQFIIPGLVMMTILQNAFSNTSSSLIQSKMHGNLTFVMLSPISPLELYLAFVSASIVRGLAVGLGVLVVGIWGFDIVWQSPMWILLFAVLSAAVMGGVGMTAGILADKYDHLAAFQNFIIIPLTFLSGVFYSIHALPEFWQVFSHFNPFFYMVDGFRFGFFNQSDVSVLFSLAITVLFLVAVTVINLILLYKGVKIRH
ncbi:MAG: metal-dependent hydrolase [Piscirickettsiaceae bacterium CG_4_9_14_3_um_filter_43_564]|nr:MAG: metal-dependent hydrolase [Piscirickettsiaceae bacterium CG07_land_8_20_14_0_80_44_28]PIW57045.1 MAG: metal-dependent hydrolase [Piscirickettsiaceae bacterium CG12_big_fil_rev_8_21_14_0_65_44_934]PIY76367.1 MAG: metal-dependent hydrolase [Piscirickettsiaceae bacterium CG_4_10_14_0_8_um_filter_44_742]PIZ73435.1 MAG: metal-dependent hydrolase [Piscirickettsiaceae bacterium CG_4_10_14_0_2_um_filter_44_336]PJA66411.1 MAG: metal-dependent hydrolase [Piscirickettsiaceae bacterium CG_4_9_14_3_